MFEELSLKGIPNRKVNQFEKFILASEQEHFVVKALNDTYGAKFPNYVFMTSGEWNGQTKEDLELNRIIGDIICIDKSTGKCVCSIDLKVAEYGVSPNLVGTITLNSYFGFGNKTYSKNRYYMMCNAYGENLTIVDAADIRRLFDSNLKFLRKSQYNRQSFGTDHYDWTKKFYDENIDYVAKEDFILSVYAKKLNIRK